jgi:hypothetical protein
MKLIWQLLVAGIVATSLSSCKKSPHEPASTVVHGQVFLVLKSGTAVKLALASVHVVPEVDALAAAETAKKQFETTQGLGQGDLSQEISSLAAQLAAKRDALRKRQEQLTAEVDALKEKRDFSAAYTTKMVELNSIGAELARNDRLKERTEALRRNRDGTPSNPANDFAEFLLAAIKPTTITRTNADGDFTLQIPGNAGRVALLVEASREIEGLEHIVWFVWLDQVNPDSGIYLFSNHNLLTAGNEANVVNIPTASAEAEPAASR